MVAPCPLFRDCRVSPCVAKEAEDIWVMDGILEDSKEDGGGAVGFLVPRSDFKEWSLEAVYAIVDAVAEEEKCLPLEEDRRAIHATFASLRAAFPKSLALWKSALQKIIRFRPQKIALPGTKKLFDPVYIAWVIFANLVSHPGPSRQRRSATCAAQRPPSNDSSSSFAKDAICTDEQSADELLETLGGPPEPPRRTGEANEACRRALRIIQTSLNGDDHFEYDVHIRQRGSGSPSSSYNREWPLIPKRRVDIQSQEAWVMVSAVMDCVGSFDSVGDLTREIAVSHKRVPPSVGKNLCPAGRRCFLYFCTPSTRIVSRTPSAGPQVAPVAKRPARQEEHPAGAAFSPLVHGGHRL